MGRNARATKRDRWLMTGIILQSIIEKKRKKCGILIESVDGKQARNDLTQLSVHRLNQ
jgi:hypothetical protein